MKNGERADTVTKGLDLLNPLAAFRLDRDVAVITGAGSGVGYAIAIAFAQVGARIAALDRDAAAGTALVGKIVAAGGKAEAHVLDVTDQAAVDRVFAAIVETHGRLDVLVNSAGIAIRKPAVELPLADWERVMAVNATGSFLCARAAARRHMLEGDGGRIVNIASIMGFSGGIYPNVSYQTSKGAVVNLTRALAVEWARRGIRVNTVAPLLDWLRGRGPGFAEALKDTRIVRVAVNQRYVAGDHPVKPGDEVALFPPVTGG